METVFSRGPPSLSGARSTSSSAGIPRLPVPASARYLALLHKLTIEMTSYTRAKGLIDGTVTRSDIRRPNRGITCRAAGDPRNESIARQNRTFASRDRLDEIIVVHVRRE